MLKKYSLKVIKILGWISLVLITLFVILVLLIRSAWGQDIIVNKATAFVSDKIDTPFSIHRLFITFDGNAFLEQLYLEDQQGDTLLYSENLEISVGLIPLIKGDKIKVNFVDWSGVVANVNRSEKNGNYNFDYIIDAFAPPSEVPSAADTTSQSLPTLVIGTISFDNFRLNYNDEVSGTLAGLNLGAFELEMNQLDLDKMVFDIASVHLRETNASLIQSKPLPESDEPVDTTALMPKIMIRELNVANLDTRYESVPDQTNVSAKIGNLSMRAPLIDLNEQKITITNLLLAASTVKLKMLSTSIDSSIVSEPETNPVAFEWPDWKVDLSRIKLDNNNITIITDTSRVEKGLFNPGHFRLARLSLDIPKGSLQNKEAKLQLAGLTAQERSGFEVKTLSLNGRVSNSSMELADLNIVTGNNEIRGKVKLSYSSLDQVINHPEDAHAAIDIDAPRLGIADGFYFDPTLQNDPYVKLLSEKSLGAELTMNGNQKEMKLNHFSAHWGANTQAKLGGTASNVLSKDLISVKGLKYELSSTQADMERLTGITDTSGVSWPEEMRLKGEATGSMKKLTTQNEMITSEGNIATTAEYRESKELMHFDVDLGLDSLQIGDMLLINELGAVTLQTQLTGSGNDLATLKASLEAEVDELTYSGYDFSNLSFGGKMDEGVGNLSLTYTDSNLDLELVASFDLDSLEPSGSIDFNLKGADLMALGLSEEDIRTKIRLQADFRGNIDDFQSKATISDGLIIQDQTSYPIEEMRFALSVDSDSTNLNATSAFFNADLVANTSLVGLIGAITSYINQYLDPELVNDTIPNDVKVSAKMAIQQDPLLNEILVPELEEFDPIEFSFEFWQASDSLIGNLSAPHIIYAGSKVDILHFSMLGIAENFHFHVGWAALHSDPLHIKHTHLVGDVKDQQLNLDFFASDEKDTLIYTRSIVSMSEDTIIYHIDPELLILNKAHWEIEPNNRIHIADQWANFEQFVLAHNTQSLKITSPIDEDNYQGFRVNFEGFQLATFMSYFNPDESLANGALQGKLEIGQIFKKPALSADLTISQFKLMNAPMGTLSLTGASGQNNSYDFALLLKDGYAHLDLTGAYVPDEAGAQLNLQMDLHSLQAKILEHFAADYVSDAGGVVSGSVKIDGTIADPIYEGVFDFDNVRLFAKELNTSFELQQEQIKIDNEGLVLSDFTIRDSDQNQFSMDGTIQTDSYTNPSFDLKVKSNNFQAINSKKSENELYYGRVGLNADLSVKGDLNTPVIRGKAGVIEKSKFTVVVPETEVALVEREGIVRFVNRSNPDNILTRKDSARSSSTSFSGLDVNVQVKVAENAVFNIIIDERTGDNFQVSGTGDFIFGLESNGRTTLAGRYAVSDGHFEASLYNLVKRRFEIAPNGSITWSGDPMDAQLDISAIYNISTPPAPLMAAQTSAASESMSSKYRQKYPFQVFLNVDGQLLQPVISFNLSMPEEARGALGGEIYTRIRQVNAQEDQVNKQVFSLLVLNRFFPATGSDGSSGGAASIARDNVNNVLSSQLNTLSDKLIGKSGLDLDFGLNSYTAYSGEEQENRTDLNINARKNLFNDRLVVQVGSEVNIEGSGTTQQQEEGTPLIGNVSLEYLITENGRYRFKGFRKNEFQSVIDGPLIVTGFAFIFSRQFNKFNELWQKTEEELNEKEE